MDNLLNLGRRVIKAEAAALHEVAGQLDVAYPKAVELLAGTSGHVIVSGVGTTGMVARRLAHLLCNVGCPALFLHAGDSLHGSSGALRAQDVLVVLSKTGETRETCQLAEIARLRSVPIILVTSREDSTIARLSTLVLRVSTPVEVDPYDGLMAVGSSLAMEAVCDALVFGVLAVRETPQEQFLQGHPGGIVGQIPETGGEDAA